jgi:hypothetical protein
LGPALRGGGAPRAAQVRRGRAALAGVTFPRRRAVAGDGSGGHGLGAPAPDGLWQAGFCSSWGVLVVEEMTWRGPGRRLFGQPIAARWLELHGSIRARSGLTGPSVPPLICPANDCLSAVEVGSSRVAVRLLFLASITPCAFAVQAAGQSDDGGTRLWWRMLVGGEARWCSSEVPGFFVDRGWRNP